MPIPVAFVRAWKQVDDNNVFRSSQSPPLAPVPWKPGAKVRGLDHFQSRHDLCHHIFQKIWELLSQLHSQSYVQVQLGFVNLITACEDLVQHRHPPYSSIDLSLSNRKIPPLACHTSQISHDRAKKMNPVSNLQRVSCARQLWKVSFGTVCFTSGFSGQWNRIHSTSITPTAVMPWFETKAT